MEARRRRLITEGTPANASRFPFVARLYTAAGPVGFCGASLLRGDARRVLTAAHCVTDHVLSGTPLRVGIGRTRTSLEEAEGEGEVIDVVGVATHPLFNHSDDMAIVRGNDVAVLTLARARTVGEGLALDDGSYWTDANPLVDNAYVFGYGSEYTFGPQTPTLRYAHVHAHPAGRCARLLHYYLVPSNGCAGLPPYDSCTGDSGGPLVAAHAGRYVQIGIISWGLSECGHSAGVYQRAAAALAFVAEQSDGGAALAAPPFAPTGAQCGCTTTCASNGFSVAPHCEPCGAGRAYCYVEDHCAGGTHSLLFPGAKWIDCPEGRSAALLLPPPTAPPLLPPRARSSPPGAVVIGIPTLLLLLLVSVPLLARRAARWRSGRCPCTASSPPS